MRILALIFALFVIAPGLLDCVMQGFILGVGVLLGLPLVVIGIVWKTNSSPRVVTIAGLSLVTVDFLAYIAKSYIAFGREWVLQNVGVIPDLILLGLLTLLMRVVWKSDSKWVSSLAVLLGGLMMIPSGFLVFWYVDNWIWSGPDVDNLLLSLLFAGGAVLVLVGGAGALLRRPKVRAP